MDRSQPFRTITGRLDVNAPSTSAPRSCLCAAHECEPSNVPEPAASEYEHDSEPHSEGDDETSTCLPRQADRRTELRGQSLYTTTMLIMEPT